MEITDVSVVIPTYNCAAYIVKAVESLLSQDYKNGHIEIIIVDDGSSDNTRDVLKDFPVKYFHQPNSGPAKARNFGWKQASWGIICFTDADCIPEKDWVLKLVERYTSFDIAGVGGSYSIVNGESFLASLIHQEILCRHLRIPEDVDFLGSFNVSYKKNVLEETGGFNESFKHASGEDNDLAYRIKKKNYHLIFDKNIKVGHHYPTDLFKYLRHQFWHGFWRMKLYRVHPDMSGGDNYAGLLDFICPPLSLAIIFLFPFAVFGQIRNTVLWIILLDFILQLPAAFMVIRQTKQLKYISLSVVTFLRGFARGIGMFLGVLKFFVLGWLDKK